MKKPSDLLVIFLLFTGLMLTGIDRSNISVAAPAMMADLGFNAGTMGIVFSSFFWTYLVFNLPSGFLADRYGPKIVYGSAAVLWAVTTCFTGTARSLASLVACRFSLGVGEAAVFPVSSKIVNERFLPEMRGTVTGIYMAGYRLGMAITPVAVAYIIQRWGWRISFYVTAAITLAWVILWFLTFPKLTAFEKESASQRKKMTWVSLRRLLTNRNTISIIIIKFLSDYLVYMIISWLPAYLFMERHFTIVKMGIYASLPWIAGMVALPLVGMISDSLIKAGKSKTFARKVPLVVSQLLASTIVLTPWVESPMVAIAILVFVVTAESAVSGVLWVVPTELAPAGEAGTLGGIMNTAGSIAGVLSPIITGFIVMATGSFTMAFVVAGVAIVLSALFVIFLLGELKPIDLKETPPSPAPAGHAGGSSAATGLR